MALQYRQWVAWEIVTKQEMGIWQKTHAVPSWILFMCLSVCGPVYVCLNSMDLEQVKSTMWLPV